MVHRALSDKAYLLLGLLSPLKGGCIGSSESTHVKMPHCWKSRVTAQMYHTHYPVISTLMVSLDRGVKLEKLLPNVSGFFSTE